MERAPALLAAVPGMIAEAPAGAQAYLLLRLAEVELKLDKATARKRLDQAFGAPASVPETSERPDRQKFLCHALTLLAEADLDNAIERLPMVANPKPKRGALSEPLRGILHQLIARKQLERAVELGSLYGGDDIAAVAMLLKALPLESPHRPVLVSNVGAAFDNPYCETTCTGILKDHRSEIPDSRARLLAAAGESGDGDEGRGIDGVLKVLLDSRRSRAAG